MNPKQATTGCAIESFVETHLCKLRAILFIIHVAQYAEKWPCTSVLEKQYNETRLKLSSKLIICMFGGVILRTSIARGQSVLPWVTQVAVLLLLLRIYLLLVVACYQVYVVYQV